MLALKYNIGGKMFKYIDSKYTKKQYIFLDFKLTDFNIATIVWNKCTLTHNDKLKALRNLHDYTNNLVLKIQIKERLDYEEKILSMFTKTSSDSIYLLKNCSEKYIYGVFSKYETAYLHACKIAAADSIKIAIEKYIVITNDTLPALSNKVTFNSNLYIDNNETYGRYGNPAASMVLNKYGEVINICSYELAEEKSSCHSYDRNRFEYQFINVPYVHHKGLPVKNTITNEYGILNTSKAEWNNFLENVKNGLHADYSDIVHNVYCLTEYGYWCRQHWSPFELEVEMPNMSSDSTPKERALIRALDALSDYLSGYNDDNQAQLVLSTTQQYSDICVKLNKTKQFSNDLMTVNDILY